MHDQIKKIAATALMLGSVGSAAPAMGQIQIRSYSSETYTTEREYDTGSRNLRVRCVSASQGVCRVFVTDAGVQRTISIRPGKSATFRQLSSNALTCTLGKNPTTVCSWERISPVE